MKILYNIFANLFPKIVSKYTAFRILIRNNKSYLYESGWMDSLLNHSLDLNSKETVPWINYPLIDFLNTRLNKKINMFEFGSGSSTIYFSNYVKKITSVEHDWSFYAKLLKIKPDNVELKFCNYDLNGNYCREICNNSNIQYDIILVDGRDRNNCIKQSIKFLSKSGVVILDDSYRKKYREGISLLLDNGFRLIEFKGIKPRTGKSSSAMIFYKDNNCLLI